MAAGATSSLAPTAAVTTARLIGIHS